MQCPIHNSTLKSFIWSIIKKHRGFSKSNFVSGKFFLIRSSTNLPWGSCEVPQNFLARSVQPFWRLSDTNRQTSKVYIQMWYLIYTYSDKAFKVTAVNRALPSLSRGLLEITLTFPLTMHNNKLLDLILRNNIQKLEWKIILAICLFFFADARLTRSTKFI